MSEENKNIINEEDLENVSGGLKIKEWFGSRVSKYDFTGAAEDADEKANETSTKAKARAL